MTKILVLLWCLLLMSGCGGNASTQVSNSQTRLLATSSVVRADYANVVQQLYVSYFGRPADAAGLTFYEDILVNAGAPTTLPEFNAAYGSNAAVKTIIDGFGTSAESTALYGSDTGTLVNAIYNNLFNRDAEPAGQAFWVNLIDNGTYSKGQAALIIMNFAQSTDMVTTTNKVTVAKNFTAALTTSVQSNAYNGLEPNATVRTMLRTVTDSTDTAAFQSTVSSVIDDLVDHLGLSVIESSPKDGATDVARSSDFAVMFSLPPNPDSITGASVKLLGPEGNTIATTATVNGAELQLAPVLSSLPGNTRYTVNFTSAITDTSGGALAAPYTRSFTTLAQNWGLAATTVASLPYFTSGTSARSAVDSAGNVTAVWAANVAGINRIYASRMNGMTGVWASPSTVYVLGADNTMSNPILVMGANGDLYLEWVEYVADGSVVVRLANFVAATNSWSTSAPANLVPDGGVPEGATLAVDSSGNITFLTRAYGVAPGPGLFAKRYTAASGSWSATQRIDTPGDNYFLGEKAVVDASGNVTVAWVQNYGLYSARYDSAAGTWSAPNQLDSFILTGTFNMFSMALDASGAVTIVWADYSGIASVVGVKVSRFALASGSWTTPVQIDSGTGTGAYSPVVAADPAGYVTVVWSQWEGMYGARFNPVTQAWSSPQILIAGSMGIRSNAPSVSADIAGNVTVVFDLDSRMTAMQYLSSDGQWHASVNIGNPATGAPVFVNAPVTLADSFGTVTAVWIGQNTAASPAEYAVMANRFN